jgi:hypothetical protein
VVRGGVEPPTFRFSGGRSYRLSYLTSAIQPEALTAAVLTGFEPATSTLTGWRALQLLYRTLLCEASCSSLARAYHRRDNDCRACETSACVPNWTVGARKSISPGRSCSSPRSSPAPRNGAGLPEWMTGTEVIGGGPPGAADESASRSKHPFC